MAQRIEDKVYIKVAQMDLVRTLVGYAQETLSAYDEPKQEFAAVCVKHAPEFDCTPEHLEEKIYCIMGIGGRP